MALRITSDVKVKRDENGVVRQLHHPRQAFTTQAGAVRAAAAAARAAGAAAAGAAIGPPDRRALADTYLREVLPHFAAGDDMLTDVRGAVGTRAAPEGPKLRFEKEKVVREQATVSYVQTCMTLPVWGSGVTVRMTGDPPRVTGSQSSLATDIDISPPAADAPYLPEQIDQAVLARLLDIDPSAPQPTINGTAVLVYRCDLESRGACRPDQDDEEQMHVAGPTLDVPQPPESIETGRHYVVTEVQFTLACTGWDDVNWSAFIEPDTGAVLLLRAFVGCLDAFVFQRDPLTATGNAAIRPSSSAAVLNSVRDRVTLPGLTTPPDPAEQQQLRGEFVRLVDISTPFTAPPAEPQTGGFFYGVPSDDFSATNAYYHCDRLFRLMQGMGFDVAAYFDGTTFPVRVDHRVSYGGTANTVNASAPGNFQGNGSDGFRFALVQRDTNVGMAVDWRVVLHEFGHSILWDNVNSPNFRFAHSAGDSLAAILNDVETSAPDAGRTFPWNIIARRHDRPPQSGFAWGGIRDDTFPVGDWRSRDRAGYDREQILSSSLFRLYSSLGGGHAEVEVRRAASRYVVQLVFQVVGSITRFAQPQDAEDFADLLMDADLGATTFEGVPGGVAHKLVRWAFEQQGLYQPPGAPTPVRTAGAPPPVDVYVDDGRAGEYTPAADFVTDTTEIWTRAQADGGTGHQDPVDGNACSAYVRISNRGTAMATGVDVRLLVATNPIDPTWPSDWAEIGSVSAPDVPPGGTVIAGPIPWTPSGTGARGMLASVEAAGDPSNADFVSGTLGTARLVHADNNLALRTVTVSADVPVDDSPGSPETTIETAPDRPIPDADATGISSTLQFQETGAIAQLAVSIDIQHTYIGDLSVTLVSPAGTEVSLHGKSNDSTDDLVRTYSTESNAALATLRGQAANGEWRLHVADLVGQDVGRLRRWGLTIELAPADGPIRLAATPGLAIPDQQPAGVASTLTVAQDGTVGSIAVDVDIRHTYRGDLVVKITSPGGTAITLHNKQGTSADDLIATYTRTNLPALAAFAGEPVRGDWTLAVADVLGGDLGTLRRWGLEIIPAAAPSTGRGASNPGAGIPDDDPTGIVDSLTIAEIGDITRVRARVEITHTFIGDLRVELTSPSGTIVRLHDEIDGDTDDLLRTYTSQDFAPLAALLGEPGGGAWRLHVSDLAGRDVGTLEHWSLELTY